MTSVLSRDRRPAVGIGVVGVVMFALAVVVAAAVTAGLTRAPARRAIEVVNPYQWRARVVVGQTGLGTVGRERSATFDEVLDQGDTWTFRFSYGGVDGGEVGFTREDLVRQRWRVTVPESFAREMRANGIPESS